MSEMTGLLADYGIDTDDIEVPSFEIEDGIYHFVIGDVFVQHGTKADPDGPDSIVISYRLSDEEGDADGQEKREYFNLPVDPEAPTEDEAKKLGWYVSRIMSLGFKRTEVNSVDRDDLIGLTGTMQLVHVAGKGKNKGKEFQNIRNLRVSEDGARVDVSDAPAPAPAKKAAAPKAAVAESPEEPEEEVEAPVAKAAPKAKAAAKPRTAPGNPFA